jgi:ATP-dependent DNA helicase RecG
MALGEDGIRTVADFLLRLPFRYEDRSRSSEIASIAAGEPVTLRVRISGVRRSRMRRGGLRIEALANDSSGAVRVLWHNRYASFADALERGPMAYLFGAAEPGPGGSLRLENPETELVSPGEEADPLHTGRIVPIHRRSGGISSRLWRTLVRRALDRLARDFRGATASGAALRDALEKAHFPESAREAQAAWRRLADEELFVLAARIEERRARLKARTAPRLPADATLRREAAAALPFALTGAQKRALSEIATDLAEGSPMTRLLQGDVGSGKTAVAGLAVLLAARHGVQAALMAPTEILAEQHAASLASWLEKAGVRLGLLTGRVRGAARSRLLAALAAGEIDLLVGTHALIEDPVRFRRLALVVIDEQHRFGVAHRARLFRKGGSPHLLVMTATPIPRSLAWAIYGELDVSVLDEKPPGRARVKTRVRGDEARERIYRFAAERVSAGERAYVVVPAIEPGPREVAAARETLEGIRRAVPDAPAALLHGRMKPEERTRVLADFASGRVGILVSTTVVEVGVDVPEATLMVVENAEAFGLAQLHQLRGRVGRSHRPSWCALIAGPGASPEALARLAILERSDDGFVIAEKDLEARGPGDLLGSRQSGLPPLRVADPFRDLARLGAMRRDYVRRRAGGEIPASDLFGYE